MYIAEIAFSFDWFLTIPGMLISGGVLLLIIALIMMIVGSSKSKKKKGEVPSNLESEQSVAAPSMNMDMNSTVPEVNSVNDMNQGLGPITNDMMESTTVVPSMEPAMEQVPPVSAPEMPEVVMPNIVVDAPVTPIEPVQVVNDEVAPMSEVAEPIIPTIEPVMPAVEPVMSTEAIPAAEPVVPVQQDTTIYGGNPIPAIEPMHEEARPIYGGADPLEATQNLPKMDVHHEPYSGGKEVSAIPTIEPIAPSVPEVAPIQEAAPVVGGIPPVEVGMNQPVQEPVITPIEVTPIDVIEPKVVTPEPVAPAQAEVVQIPDIEQL